MDSTLVAEMVRYDMIRGQAHHRPSATQSVESQQPATPDINSK
jgi:hypothetical protein